MEAVAAIPESLEAGGRASSVCPGVTSFNPLRHSGALPRDLVAVQGIEGLGHLGIQFALEIRLQGRRNRARAGERRSRQEARGEHLHRQRRKERRGGAEKARRRTRDPGDIWKAPAGGHGSGPWSQ